MWVLLGAPGAGKGTQALRLADALGLIHVSTGELFRAHMHRRTPLGLDAESYMSRGELVPDDTVVGMVADRLAAPDAAAGAVLDGFPRTLEQAQALDRLLAATGHDLPQAVELDVPMPVLMARLTGRRVSHSCPHTYHVLFHPPRTPDVCDIDGSPLYQRSDDAPETVARRLDVYYQTIGPVAAYFRDRGRLISISGEGGLDEVTDRLREALHAAPAA